MSNVTLIGIDTAKSVFHLHAVERNGKMVYQKKLTRKELLPFLAQVPSCVVALETCTASHYWARKIHELGHETQLISARRVNVFASRNKNDFNDARAVTKASRDPDTYFVAQKSIEQQTLQAIHTARDAIMKQQTATVNITRALLAEFGIIVSQGRQKLMKTIPLILEDAENMLPDLIRGLVDDYYQRLISLNTLIKSYEKKLKQCLKLSPQAKRLTEIPGVGLIISTAMVFAIADPHVYKNGRQLAASLGLTPKEHSSGGVQRMGKLSKEGNPYIRKILVQGAHALLQRVHQRKDPLSQWAHRLKTIKGTNLAAIALANKIARICWAMMAKQELFNYQSPQVKHMSNT